MTGQRQGGKASGYLYCLECGEVALEACRPQTMGLGCDTRPATEAQVLEAAASPSSRFHRQMTRVYGALNYELMRGTMAKGLGSRWDVRAAQRPGKDKANG
jgi:hypothetical protein